MLSYNKTLEHIFKSNIQWKSRVLRTKVWSSVAYISFFREIPRHFCCAHLRELRVNRLYPKTSFAQRLFYRLTAIFKQYGHRFFKIIKPWMFNRSFMCVILVYKRLLPARDWPGIKDRLSFGWRWSMFVCSK